MFLLLLKPYQSCVTCTDLHINCVTCVAVRRYYFRCGGDPVERECSDAARPRVQHDLHHQTSSRHHSHLSNSRSGVTTLQGVRLKTCSLLINIYKKSNFSTQNLVFTSHLYYSVFIHLSLAIDHHSLKFFMLGLGNQSPLSISLLSTLWTVESGCWSSIKEDQQPPLLLEIL